MSDTTYVSFNIDEMTHTAASKKYTGMRLYYIDEDFTLKSYLCRFTESYPDGKEGVSTEYLKTFVRKALDQLDTPVEVYSVTTDAGSDVKAACSSGEFGSWSWCINHLLSRAMMEAWNKSEFKKMIAEIIRVCAPVL
jgi:hypothetical protein